MSMPQLRPFLTLLSSTTLVAGIALVALNSCDPKADEAHAAPALTKAAPQPTAEHALDRARARWDHIAKGEWIDAYEFQSPEVKRKMDLSHYLNGKAHHTYENPKVEGILKLEKNFVLVRSTVLWTPHTPELQRVKLEPGQTVTQEVPMIETWKWDSGDWYIVEQKGTDEFFKKHPELLKEGEDVDGHPLPKTGDAASNPKPVDAASNKADPKNSVGQPNPAPDKPAPK